jgi:cyanophycinase
MRRCRLVTAALLLLGLQWTASVESAAAGPRLLLAGGATPVCSNLSPQACLPDRVPATPPLAARYRLNAEGIERVAGGWWHSERSRAKRRALTALRRWHADAGDIDFAAADVPIALDAVGANARQRWAALADFERARILEALERAAPVEQVALADSSAASGAAIFREFVAMAAAVSGRARPHVLVSTASSRDPYGAIDFYLALFEQAGAEVRWLPLDHALRAAQANPEDDCTQLDRLRGERWGAQDRARLHPARAAELVAACRDPALLQDLLDWADGVFLNGGDQSFTRAAWHAGDGAAPSAELLRLLQRLDAGGLVLGGTSAGTAVQAAAPGVMLVSGAALPTGAAQALSSLPPDPDCRSAEVCGGIDPDALLWHPGGGLGSFPLGVLDTHFSERGREYRLARLLLDTTADTGVGIDENSALRLDRTASGWHARVIGTGAATLLRRVDAQRLLWTRHAAGTSFNWPAQVRAPRCAAPPQDALRVSADSTALRDALIAATTRQALPLQLHSGTRVQAIGQVCAGVAEGERVWEFPPATASADAIIATAPADGAPP